MKRFHKLVALCVFGAIALPSGFPAWAMDDAGKQEIEKIVHDYLLANPDLLLEMRDLLEAKRRTDQEAKQRQTLAAEKDAIYSSENQIVIGPADAQLTVVEFFDYNCAFCQRALSDMNRLVDGGGRVRFILREFPVLGDDFGRRRTHQHRLQPADAP